MDKHKIVTKIIAIIMIGAMILASCSTLLFYLFTK